MKKGLIVVRGAGDLATGTIHRLWSAGFRLLVLETEQPAAIRRQVALSEAVYAGTAVVEGARAVRIHTPAELESVLAAGDIPLLTDPAAQCIPELRPAVVVDAILAKRNLGTHRGMAPLTIALGPGFTAGEDVDAVVETMRGHDLGRIIRQGSARPDTGVPGVIGGYGAERVIHAGRAGVLRCRSAIGDFVEQGQTIAVIEHAAGTEMVPASISGLLRGLIRDGYPVTEGFKIADIDPRRSEYQNCFTISDKARCIAGSVLELVCRHFAEVEASKR